MSAGEGIWLHQPYTLYFVRFSQLIVRHFDCSSYLLLWSKPIHWSIQLWSVMFQSTRRLCIKGSQKGLPRSLFSLWKSPENKYLLWLCSLVSWIPFTLPKIRNCLQLCSFCFRFFPLLMLGEASLDMLFPNVQTEPGVFLLDLFRTDEVLLAMMLR